VKQTPCLSYDFIRWCAGGCLFDGIQVIAPKWINFELHRKDMTQLEAVLTKAVALAGEKAGKRGSFMV